ncbi:MAG: hypothetical protein QM778_15125 [Myxococcales bacterium]
MVYGITRALRAKIQESQVARIQAEIRDLGYAVKAGSVDAETYAARAEQIRRACEDLGVEVPDLPLRLPEGDERDG